MHYLFLVQKDLLLEHFFLTIQNQKYGTFVDVKRSTMYVFKMVFKNFSSKSFQQKNSSNGKKRFAQILSNDFHAFSKADIKQFWWFNVTKKNGTMKELSAADSKRKMCGCSIVQQLFVFYQQNNKRPKQVPSLDFEMYQFFFSPKYFFLFRSLSSAGCISVRESLSFQNNYFGEEAKIIIKLLQTQKKKWFG